MKKKDPFLEIPLRTLKDTTGEVKRVLGKLEERGQCLKTHRILVNSSATFLPLLLLLSSLPLDAALPAQDREVVILHLEARRGVDYEWDEHVPESAQLGLVTPSETRLVTERSTILTDSSFASFSV